MFGAAYARSPGAYVPLSLAVACQLCLISLKVGAEYLQALRATPRITVAFQGLLSGRA